MSAPYGYSRGTWFYVTASGLRCSYRTRERFRYALRNEHNVPPADAERIVAECDRQTPEWQRLFGACRVRSCGCNSVADYRIDSQGRTRCNRCNAEVEL